MEGLEANLMASSTFGDYEKVGVNPLPSRPSQTRPEARWWRGSSGRTCPRAGCGGQLRVPARAASRPWPTGPPCDLFDSALAR